MGRLHVMFSPIPYAAVYGEDPSPDLDHIFYVSGLPGGSRQSDLNGLLDSAALGRTRVSLKSRGTQARPALAAPVVAATTFSQSIMSLTHVKAG